MAAVAAPENGKVAASERHCVLCFETIIRALRAKLPLPKASPAVEDFKCPLFVTWHIKGREKGDWDLRGCIGTFSAVALQQGLAKYAHTSAFEDSRFNPIAEREIPLLSCGVSLLTNFEPAKDWTDWEIGKHGLQIEFDDPQSGRHFSATYLPEVAKEQGWSKQECIDSLMRKPGFRGSVTPQLRASLRVTRYQSSKHEITYDQYCKAVAGQ